MESNMIGGRIWKGSSAQIELQLFPPFCDVEIENLKLEFYTEGTSISPVFTLSGKTAVVHFEAAEIESLEDGLLKYNLSYDNGEKFILKQCETRWYIKTPDEYTPIEYVTKDNLDEAVEEALDKKDVVTKEWIDEQGFIKAGELPEDIPSKQYVDDSIADEVKRADDTYVKKGDTYTKDEVDQKIEDVEDKIPSLDGYAKEQWVKDQGYLTEHQKLKTINGENIVGTGDIEIKVGESVLIVKIDDTTVAKEDIAKIKAFIDNPETKNGRIYFLLDGAYELVISTAIYDYGSNYYELKSERRSLWIFGDNYGINNNVAIVRENNLGSYAKQSWVKNQGYLTEHQQLKTLNGESLVGTGDIDTTLDITLTERTTGGWDISTDDVSALFGLYTKYGANADICFNKQRVIDISVREISPVSTEYIFRTKDFSVQFTGKPMEGRYQLYITKNELADKQWVNDQGFLTEHQQLKTINGETIVGTGDIVIQGGGTIDSTMSDTSENAVQNKVIKSYVDGKVPSLDGYATEQWVEDKGYLTEHQKLKTINGETIVGNGDINTDISYKLPIIRDTRDNQIYIDDVDLVALDTFFKANGSKGNILFNEKTLPPGFVFMPGFAGSSSVDTGYIEKAYAQLAPVSALAVTRTYKFTADKFEVNFTVQNNTVTSKSVTERVVATQEWVESKIPTVDSTMSDTSTNAIQNKAVKAYVDTQVGDIERILKTL